jgi:transcriptional regulator with XRE-family HTH domain
MREQEFNRQLGALIKEARRRAGLTQEQLAARTGLSRGSIANIELGDQAPPPYRLAHIALVLGAKSAELLPTLDPVGDASGRARAVGLPDDLVALVRDVADAGNIRKDADDGAR